MSDRDYGCNAESPEGIIACILDDAGQAQEIVRELDSLGFVIVPKEPTEEMTFAGNKEEAEQFAPKNRYLSAPKIYRAMIGAARS